jgi:hypothetical protein
MDLSTAVLTEHSREQLAARGLNESAIRAVLKNPEQVLETRAGRVVAQSTSPIPGYLLRVFVDVGHHPFEVVTAYRTSKIEKYRSRP